MDGQVLVILTAVGETVMPGAALVRVGKETPVELTIYVAETDIDELEIGQAVEVTVDAYEDEDFEGEIVFIAAEAEFTPKNVQTKEDRADLVYAVRIRIPNEGGELRPGMPADAVALTD
jgi:multidrug resistance efflux pump